MDAHHTQIAKRALQATSAGDWHEADLCYRQLCEAQPTELRWRRALLDVEKLRLDQVHDPDSHYAMIKADLLRRSAERPTDAMALYELGYAHLVLSSCFTIPDEDLRLAEDAFRLATDVAPTLLAGYSGLRLVCVRRTIQGARLHDQSIEIAKLAADRVPANANSWAELGNAYSEHCDPGHRENALAACRAALTLDPELVEAHFRIACVHRVKGDIAAAICAYERVIQLDPGSSFGRDARRSLEHLLDRDSDPPRLGAAVLPAPEYVPQFKSYANNKPAFVPKIVPKRSRTGEADEP